MESFLERSIERPMKFIYIDATYFKVREDGKYRNKALYVCIAIDSEGRREILSCKLCDSETEMEWESFFDDLKNRGLKCVELVISDGHMGIQESVTRSFIGAAWQFCHVHFMRNLMKLIPKKKQSSVMQIVKQALENESLVSKAQDTLVNEGLEKASDMFERWHNSQYNYRAYSETLTANMPEEDQDNKCTGEAYPGIQENDKEDRCISIGTVTAVRRVVTIIMDINEEWITGRKYISREEN